MSPAPAPLTIEAALARIGEHVRPLPAESVALEHAYGRCLAADLGAAIALPPFDSSAMDGFAIRAADVPGALRIAGESAAGMPYDGALRPGEAVTISTGAVVPDGADAVVPIEDVAVAGDTVRIGGAVTPDAFVRRRGSDIDAGAPMLRAGVRIGPAQIGAAAAVGLAELPCHRRPRVAVLATGDELRPPGELLAAGEIYDANGPMLRAALRTAGCEVTLIPSAGDTVEAHRTALAQALEHDVVISTGGVSVGAHDLVRGVGRELGVREVFWRVALRPGKPLAFGVRDETLVFGLPGNPVSTLVCFELFVRPALLARQGARWAPPRFGRARLAVDVERNPERDDLIRTRLRAVDGDGLELHPLAGQQSHQIAVTAQADALARIPTGEGTLPAGTEVEYLPLHHF